MLVQFQPPRPHRGWQLIQAVDYGPACPQPTRFTGATKGVRDMDEDCLYLNVFTPNVSHLNFLNNYMFLFYHSYQNKTKTSLFFCLHQGYVRTNPRELMDIIRP